MVPAPWGGNCLPIQDADKRDMYSADEANALMLACPKEYHLDDVFRSTLFSAGQADEIAKVDI